MRQTYKINRGSNYKAKVKQIQAWVLANPRSTLNYLIMLTTIIIVSIIIGLASKKHSQMLLHAATTPIINPETSQTKAATLNDNNVAPTTITATNDVATPPLFTEKTITVRRKDNLTKIFKRLNMDSKDAKEILTLSNAKALRALRSGQKITFSFSQNQQLEKITYPINLTDTLTISKNNSHHFQAQVDHIEPTARLEYSSLTVNSSIYKAAKQTSISRKLIAQLLNIFRDKVNLERTLHAGDKIAFLYKDYYIKDQKINKNSEIVAASYTHNGQTHKIVSFTDSAKHTKFYTTDGYALKPPFVRYPLKFKHISSPFSLHRFNPILHIFCAHTGVDLAANIGTPIKAASDGVITTIGRDGGYGNAIIIKHNQYSTLYAHMRGFAKGLHHGSFVHQGQLIGYVGMTGRATGPHLHYEFRINNIPHNPVTVKLPNGEMIAKAYRGKFFAQRNKLLAQLNLFEHKMVAIANNDSSNKAS